MSLIPDERLKSQVAFNMTPMVDFLFLMLAVFATLAITRVSLFNTDLDLVELNAQVGDGSITPHKNMHQINLSITKTGNYQWLTDVNYHPMQNINKIQQELVNQHQLGIIPSEKENTQVLLHIDKQAPWDAIAQLIYAIREIGFTALPIFQPIDSYIAENTIDEEPIDKNRITN